jgi:hypothetical protein
MILLIPILRQLHVKYINCTASGTTFLLNCSAFSRQNSLASGRKLLSSTIGNPVTRPLCGPRSSSSACCAALTIATHCNAIATDTTATATATVATATAASASATATATATPTPTPTPTATATAPLTPGERWRWVSVSGLRGAGPVNDLEELTTQHVRSMVYEARSGGVYGR